MGSPTTLVPVSNLETAEMVKLSNNCHTDLIYSFGNEIALISERHGLDPLEVIRAANLDYPRPDLAKPGYVGGGCLSKDPYIMIDSAGDREPFLVGRARALNEFLPTHVATTVVERVRAVRGATQGARLAVLGWAYKGWPPTDDMRGTPIATMMPVFAEAGLTVLGHDPMVTDDVIRQYGGLPVSLDKAFSESDAVLVINDHPDYRALRIDSVLGANRPAVIYDSWRILDEDAIVAAGVHYAGHRLPAVARAVSGVNALLLGGAGFIGLHLARRLLADGHSVTIVDDFSRGRDDKDLAEVRAHPNAAVRSADLTDPATWAALPHGWDQIYLLAAVVGVRNVESDPSRTDPGQRAGGPARDGLAPTGREGVLLLDQRGLRRRGRRRHRAGADRRGRPGHGARRDRAPVRVRHQQAPRRSRLPARGPGQGFRGGRRPVPQRVRAPDGRRPRDPRDGDAGAGRRGAVHGSGAPTSSGRSATSTTPSRRCSG